MIAKYTLKEEIDGYFYETFYFEKKKIKWK